MVATMKPQKTFETAGDAVDRSAEKPSDVLAGAQSVATADLPADELKRRRFDAARAALERNREALALLSKA